MNIKNSILLRARVVFLVVLLFALAIVYRLVKIQVIDGEEWRRIDREVTLQYRKVSATRGNILSHDGSPLATSLPFYRIAFDPSRAEMEVLNENIDSLSLQLSVFFGDRSAEHYKRRILDARGSGKKYIILNRELINFQEKKLISSWPLFREGRLKGGVIFEKVERRYLPFSYLANRTIGYVNENMKGAGLEFSFNEALAGQDGQALYQKMAGGVWKPVYDASTVRPREGYDLLTTIDVNLQDVAEDALLRALTAHDADRGSLILMEVKTGEIRAISNLSKTKSGRFSETYNYAVGSHGLREPGSTFKLITMMALLELTGLSLEDSIDTGEGSFDFYDETVRDHEEGGLGKITVREAFEKSSNVAMAILADKYFKDQPQKFYSFLHELGLTKPLGFQMAGEGVPKIKTPDEWSGITLPWMAYGYGLELTPLQILTQYNAIANQGEMIRPVIIKSILKADQPVTEYSTEVLKRSVCSRETLLKLRDLLEGVVERGTATNIKNDYYRIAGKTGTAQLLVNRRHSRKYNTSFVGYFPAEDPLYSCIVVIENPKGFFQYGSNVAAPVFKEVADKIYASNLHMHQPLSDDFIAEIGIFPVIRSGNQRDLNMICNEIGVSNHSKSEEEWVRAKINGNAVDWMGKTIKKGIVPDVTGMTLRDAVFLMENCGATVKIEGKGRVKKQSRMPGKKVRTDEPVTLTLG